MGGYSQASRRKYRFFSIGYRFNSHNIHLIQAYWFYAIFCSFAVLASWVLRSAMRVRFATIQPCPFDDVSCSYGENHIPTATSPIHLSGCPVPADSLSQRG